MSTSRRRHRLSRPRTAAPTSTYTRRQKEKVARISGLASALELDVQVVLPRAHDEPAHLKLRGAHGECLHVVVFGSGEAARLDPPDDGPPIPAVLVREMRGRAG